jgi:hypothetical protein
MISGEEQKIGAQDMSLQIVWRNPHTHVRACLRARQAGDRYCRWAEQASKIRAGDPIGMPNISGSHKKCRKAIDSLINDRQFRSPSIAL